MRIERFVSRYLGANGYLISENGHGILIDGVDSPALLERLEAERLQMDFALLTHEHADHCAGVSWIQTALRIPVICSETCGEHLLDTRMNYSEYFDFMKDALGCLGQDPAVGMEPFVCRADECFTGERTLPWQGHSLYLRETPGHAAGSIAIVLDGTQAFLGDTLFENAATVTRFKGGSKRALESVTMPWLESLGDVTVYPGHFTPFSLTARLKRADIIK